MKVLSLFDGISCGRVALERAGIKVEKYDAFEIDKYAIPVSQKNYPDIIQHGDVFNGDFTQFKGYDLLIGGSPCQHWSIAKVNRETTPDGGGGKLFLQYVRALKESECRYFLYENNNSIHNNIKEFISKELGVEPITINSALLSAQQRRRCYWTNIPKVTQPNDKGILLKDILENGQPINDDNGKSRTIKASYMNTSISNLTRQDGYGASGAAIPVDINKEYGLDNLDKKDIKIRKDGKEDYITAINKNSTICKPIRIGEFGKGGQGQRIYSVYGKSVTLMANSGGLGANTGLYKIDLPDGDYIIRKLTPIEAERLQTLPDNYTEGISNTQRYKCIGNGWTVDIIVHILKNLKEEIK